MQRFSERWNTEAARGFDRAREAGIAETLSAFLQEFRALHRFAKAELASLSLPDDAVRFLADEGLPEDATPSLALERRERLLRPVLEIWPFEFPRGERRARLERCFSLYLDGSGNPVCLDAGRGGELVWFDHDTELVTERLVNSSVQRFAEFQLLRLEERSAGDLYRYASVDERALLPGTFWHSHFASA